MQVLFAESFDADQNSHCHVHSLLRHSREHNASSLSKVSSWISFAQALVMTHEGTDYRQFDTYLWRKLAPVRPLLSFGRSATAEPRTKPQYCVWHWWQDCLCSPLSLHSAVNDHHHPRDSTLKSLLWNYLHHIFKVSGMCRCCCASLEKNTDV